MNRDCVYVVSAFPCVRLFPICHWLARCLNDSHSTLCIISVCGKPMSPCSLETVIKVMFVCSRFVSQITFKLMLCGKQNGFATVKWIAPNGFIYACLLMRAHCHAKPEPSPSCHLCRGVESLARSELQWRLMLIVWATMLLLLLQCCLYDGATIGNSTSEKVYLREIAHPDGCRFV